MAKRRKLIDPFAMREAQKYPNPIPSRELIIEVLKKSGKPATCEQLQKILGVTHPEQREALRRRLHAMERDGQLASTRRGSYGLVGKMNLIAGRVIGHRDGYGFVVADDGSDDLFLSARYMRAIFDGDRVLVRVANVDKRGRREAALVQVLEHNTQQLVGRFINEGGATFVIPDHKRISQEILIPPGQEQGARHGQIVTVAITTQPSILNRAIGRVIEILGDYHTPGMEIDIAIRSYGLPHIWPEDVLAEAQQFQEPIPGADYADREDIRNLPLVTIDGEDAKDFDDAVYCAAKPTGGWRLIVAIADVSHYVQSNTALDKEAFNRGNSVYFPDNVIPMLPEALSNNLCSLNPNVDRFCMVCDMQISTAGKITRYRFYPAVMHSRARLTYTQVAKALQGEKQACEKLASLLPHIEELHRLYRQLYKNREARGALDFDTVETKVIFGEKRKIKAIVPVVRNDAHKLIEECMLCANVAAARWLIKNRLPALFRIHDGPTIEKLADLRDFLREFNLGLRGGKSPKPVDYASLLKSIQLRPDARIIQTVLLRSLKQAVYSPNNLGHFGLAYPAYTHFTSPIRRYPDLLIHRLIRLSLAKKKKISIYDEGSLIHIGEKCSLTERRADEATRSALDALKCEFMSSRVGEEFTGLITSVTGFGLFVELTDLYIEGLIHISTLPNDYYYFDPIKHRLIGERTGTRYCLGDRVEVKVARVDIENKKIDFILMSARKHGKSKKR